LLTFIQTSQNWGNPMNRIRIENLVDLDFLIALVRTWASQVSLYLSFVLMLWPFVAVLLNLFLLGSIATTHLHPAAARASHSRG